MSNAVLGPIYGPTWRSSDGCARVAYRGDWSETRPFFTYIHGTAGMQFPTLRGALAYLEQRGFAKFKKDGE